MPRKKHDNLVHDDRCAKPLDDTHLVCPLKPLPGLEWVHAEVVQAGKIKPGDHKVMFAAPGGRENFIISADAADALGAELLRVAALARKANKP
jgi:hypothetical protein